MPHAQRVNVADPQAIEERALWIYALDGTLVNMAVEAKEFDRVVTEYVDLYDREHWPLAQRSDIILAARGAIPTFYVPADELTPAMQAQVQQLGASATHDSTQVKMIEQAAGARVVEPEPESGDEEKDATNPGVEDDEEDEEYYSNPDMEDEEDEYSNPDDELIQSDPDEDETSIPVQGRVL